MAKNKTKNKLLSNILLGLVVALIVLYAVNVIITGKIIGSIRTEEKQRPANLHLTLVKPDCENCIDFGTLISAIKQQNVKILQEKNLSYAEAEAKSLVSENNIKSLPALVVKGEVSHPDIASLWDRLGAKPANNVVVISGIPPFYNVAAQKIEGLVQVIKLTDISCVACYDVELHMQILPRFGVFVSNATAYDISSGSGKDLVQKYNIAKVPAILLSPDASVYPAIVQVWSGVGTKEKDGWFVFRNVEQMGTYRDLNQNTIINASR